MDCLSNSRILSEYITEGMNVQAIQDYLSYSAKIGELATRFTWVSVLSYDDEYRRNQAVMNYRWGSDSQHLSTVNLREREQIHNKAQTKKNTSQQKGNRDTGSTSDSQCCGYYNYGRECPYGDRCIFPHICALCGKKHKKIEHKESGDRPPRFAEKKE